VVCERCLSFTEERSCLVCHTRMRAHSSNAYLLSCVCYDGYPSSDDMDIEPEVLDVGDLDEDNVSDHDDTK
jgi:hypothetical protein